MSELTGKVDFYRNCGVYLRDHWMRIITENPSVQSALMRRMTFELLHKGRRKEDYFVEDIPCFDIKSDGRFHRIVAPYGFFEAVMQVLYDFGIGAFVVDMEKNARIEDPYHVDVLPFKINTEEWKACRNWQQEAVQVMNSYSDARFQVATAGGKSHLIKMLCKWLPESKILITDSSLSRLNDRFEDILKATGSCGIFHSGRKQADGRILVCSSGMLSHFKDVKWDIFIADEIHTLMSPDHAANLAMVDAKRWYGFSANVQDRSDNADMWGEAFFGPVRVRREYQDVLDDEDVVPIVVEWLDYPGGPIYKVPKMLHERQRALIWDNQRRNELFAEKAKFHVANGRQTLVLTETTEHALRMGKLLGWPVVTKPPTPVRRLQLEAAGLLKPDQLRSTSYADKMQELFKKKEVLGIIANKVWHTGKDFVSLEVLCRMDAGASEIPNTQIPGRLARKAPGKPCGLLIDCTDRFEFSAERRSETRASSYAAKGWQNVSSNEVARWAQR